MPGSTRIAHQVTSRCSGSSNNHPSSPGALLLAEPPDQAQSDGSSGFVSAGVTNARTFIRTKGVARSCESTTSSRIRGQPSVHRCTLCNERFTSARYRCDADAIWRCIIHWIKQIEHRPDCNFDPLERGISIPMKPAACRWLAYVNTLSRRHPKAHLNVNP